MTTPTTIHGREQEMKLTQNTIKQADRIIHVTSAADIPFKGLLRKIAVCEVNAHGFYSLVMGDKKVLIVSESA